jgi:hypothetical protein
VEAFAERLTRLNESRHIEHVLFHMQPRAQPQAAVEHPTPTSSVSRTANCITSTR